MIDTLGWGSAEDGIFRLGGYSYKSNRYRDLPAICNFNGEGGTVYFVHDGSWRLATDMELCWMLAIAIPTRRLLLAEKPGG